MAFIPIPNVVEAALVMSQDGQEVINTLYFEKATAWSVADLNTLGGGLVAWWDAQYQNLTSNTVSLNEIRLTDLSSQTAPGIVFTTGLPLVGAKASPAMPNNVTVAVSFHTALRGRSYRGRNYFVGLTEGDVVGNLITSSLQGELITMYLALTGTTYVTVGTWVVASRYNNGAPRAAGVGTPIEGVSLDRTIDSQRRRLPGRGR